MKKFIYFVILVLFCLNLHIPVNANELPSCSGVVKEVQYEDMDENELLQVKQVANIKILNGENKGSVVEIDNMLSGNPFYDINLKKGLKVILHVEQDEMGNISYSVEDIKRSNVLGALLFIFCALLLYIGKKNGIFSLVSILLTCVLIYYCLSPLILAGVNSIAATLLVCVISTLITMYLVGGLNRKSTSASIGCILSIVCAGFLSFLTVKFAHLTGFVNENSAFLFSAHPKLNMINILIASMLLAVLGAVMDVAMSIASTINEIYTVDNNKSTKELFISGMNVGRDIIGTMANTLILVYLGGALPLLLLLSDIDMGKFLNLNQVVTEMSSALIGSCAVVICVPITAIVSANLIKSIHHKKEIDLSNM